MWLASPHARPDKVRWISSITGLCQIPRAQPITPLKKAYGRQAEDLMRNRITHITKLEFLLGFIRAYNAAITPSNIQGGF